MFDRYYQRDPHPTHLTVTSTEKRAPTDESVRLLREMEQAALDKVTASIRLENTIIDGVIHQMRDPIRQQTDYAVVLKINGKQSEVKCTLRGEQRLEEVAGALHRAVADHIAELLLIDSFKSVRW